jgi:glycine/D-amino acid oxidase-like deaminating enzyme
VEPGLSEGSPEALAELRHLGGHGPDWLREAEPLRHWQGLRARPDDRPAPLLEQLEPGLLLTSGHYRNGVLLAPATAAWVLQQLEQPSA